MRYNNMRICMDDDCRYTHAHIWQNDSNCLNPSTCSDCHDLDLGFGDVRTGVLFAVGGEWLVAIL